MAKTNKSKLLLLFKYLWDNTDESHTVTVVDMIKYLEDQGIGKVARGTIYDDIDALIEFGVPIEKHKGTQNHYWIAERFFSPAELQLLVDAVQAAQFISKKRSEAIVEKLTAFAGFEGNELLNRKLLIESRPKATNENILFIVNELQYAINHKKKVNFKYVDYNPQKKKVYRHDGQVYSVSPFSMLWNGDNYYMIGYSDSHKDIARFRVNRIDSVTVTEENAVRKPKGYKESDYYSQIFSMYDGPECEIELLCTNDLMNIMVDRFGTGVDTEIVDDEHFKVTTTVHLSNVFYGWVCSLGGKARLLAPESAVDQFNELMKSFLKEG